MGEFFIDQVVDHKYIVSHIGEQCGAQDFINGAVGVYTFYKRVPIVQKSWEKYHISVIVADPPSLPPPVPSRKDPMDNPDGG